MKIKRSSIDYITFIKYLCTFFAMFIFSKINIDKNIFSIAVFSSTIFICNNILINIIIHFLTVLITKNFDFILSIALSDFIMIIVCLFYKKYKVKMKYEIFAYMLLSLIPFYFLSISNEVVEIYDRIYQIIFTSLLTVVLYKTITTITEKGIKYKLNYEEYIFIILCFICFGLGFCNATTPLIWKSICIFIMLMFSYIYKIGITCLISSIMGISLSIYYNDLTFISIFLMLSISIESMMSLSRYLSSLLIICVDYGIFYFFKCYGTYTLHDLFSVLIPSIIFILIPNKFLEKIKDKLQIFNEKQLSRLSINRNRIMLSNKLYELSSLFNEIALTFSIDNEDEENFKREKNIILEQVLKSVCHNCSIKNSCNIYQKNQLLMEKIIEIGIAKGKLTLIDFQKEICEQCIHSNNILFALNKLINEYKDYLSKKNEYIICRNLLKEETLGVSDVLKGIAIDSGTLLKYQSNTERKLANELYKNGIKISELLIYGEGINTSISIVITMKEFSISQIENIIKKTTKFDMTVCEKIEICEEKVFLAFKISAPYDAVFGLSILHKDGSIKSGDTHTVTRIKDDKFLIALSDGMGSGEKAEKVSSTSLSLIETFYKAGLNNKLILTSINKLLNVNCDDNFTALDVAVIDLKNCSCDFIKYGSPYGYIINKEGIKIVESNNLPLGILENIKPSVASTTLKDGDIILLCTDGVSDSFGSSGEFIEFLRTQPALNPQTLSDNIMNKALELTNGIKKDDMTILSVKIFLKKIA